MSGTQVAVVATVIGWPLAALVVALLIGRALADADRREQPTVEDDEYWLDAWPSEPARRPRLRALRGGAA